MTLLSSKSFKINIALMSAFRLLHPTHNFFLYKLQAYTYFIIFALPVPIFGSMFFIFSQRIEMEQIVDNAFLVAEMSCQVAKLFSFMNKSGQIRKCLGFFDSGVYRGSNQDQELILGNYVKVCRRNTMIFVVAIIGGNIAWVSRPLMMGVKKLPVDVWLPVQPQGSSFYFFYIFLAIGVAYVSMSCAAIDPLIGGLAFLASAQLDLIKHSLQNLKEDNTNNTRHKFNTVTYKLIVKNIQHHCSVLRFITEFQECFSTAVFSQFIGSSVVICFCCLQLSKLDPLSYNFISMIMFLSVFLAQIYIYCYYGTILYEQSNTLTEAIYLSKWYQYDLNCQKLLIIFMGRTKKPLMITAGKLLDLSIATFTTLLKRSYSLLAVLNNQ